MGWIAAHIGDVMPVIMSALGTAWAAIRWFGARLLAQHDELTKRVDKLERDYVTRKELADMREELSRHNRDTQARLDQILYMLANRSEK